MIAWAHTAARSRAPRRTSTVSPSWVLCPPSPPFFRYALTYRFALLLVALPACHASREPADPTRVREAFSSGLCETLDSVVKPLHFAALSRSEWLVVELKDDCWRGRWDYIRTTPSGARVANMRSALELAARVDSTLQRAQGDSQLAAFVPPTIPTWLLNLRRRALEVLWTDSGPDGRSELIALSDALCGQSSAAWTLHLLKHTRPSTPRLYAEQRLLFLEDILPRSLLASRPSELTHVVCVHPGAYRRSYECGPYAPVMQIGPGSRFLTVRLRTDTVRIIGARPTTLVAQNTFAQTTDPCSGTISQDTPDTLYSSQMDGPAIARWVQRVARGFH